MSVHNFRTDDASKEMTTSSKQRRWTLILCFHQQASAGPSQDVGSTECPNGRAHEKVQAIRG